MIEDTCEKLVNGSSLGAQPQSKSESCDNKNAWIKVIEDAWEKKLDVFSDPAISKVMQKVSDAISAGSLRVAEKSDGVWITNQWIKKFIMLLFKANDAKLIGGAPENSFWFDKISLKFCGWDLDDFKKSNIRTVPGSLVRSPSYIGKNVVLMPSYINLGSYVGDNTMIDIGASVGSCAQIGKNCHISGNVLIGGVIEPITASPVIIEDDCFIGACSSISEGIIVEEGSVIATGVHISASTKIINKETGSVTYGTIPRYSVVISGSYKVNEVLSVYCAVIVKKVDKQTREKTSINELLR